jgi:hypothetical protein
MIAARRIYVCCPGNAVSGGPEVLHQLVAALSAHGKEAYIAYQPSGRRWQTPQEYLRYQCPVAERVVDEDDSAVVVPEICTAMLKSIRAAQRVIWWLSVDNYSGNFDNRTLLKTWLTRRVSTGIDRSRPCTHLFQSEYARSFVKKRLGADGWFLSDYLADEYLRCNPTPVGRDDTILFNPKKGYGFTRKIIALCPALRFVPLINMSRVQLRTALETSKVYMDFGPHPGKDRLPREASLCGCVIVVGRRGSASNASDVPLEARYKYAVKDAYIPAIAATLDDILRNHPDHFAAQAQYRSLLRKERESFEQDLRAVFNLSPAMAASSPQSSDTSGARAS